MKKKAPSFLREPGAKKLVGYIQNQTGIEQFDLCVILGSGWKEAMSNHQALARFNYEAWPCFPTIQIPGQGGDLVATRWGTYNILAFTGRFHCYQGLSAYEAAFPVRLAAALGCSKILLTCAAGGINPTYKPGDFVLIDDHVNLLGDNPLKGLKGNLFIDLANIYARDIYDRLLTTDFRKPSYHRGIVAAMMGPSYETPAEVRFLKTIGADLVSMSIVHEAIMAKFFDLQVVAVAFIANFAAGIAEGFLSHEDVLNCSLHHAQSFPDVMDDILKILLS